MADPILDDLNPAQREAVVHRDGPMLVVAGAGSGKTRVVTRRVAALVRGGVRPWQILALTFTNKAAAEMRERVGQLVGEAPRWIGTFHSACARFLRFDLDKLGEGRTGRFSILDDADQLGLVKKIVKELGLDDPRHKPRALLSRIGQAKNAGHDPASFPVERWDDETVLRVFEKYEYRLRGQNALDFDDLLGLCVRLLEQRPEIREAYQRRFPYLLVDEYQDTNPVQYRLMRLLSGPARNVHVTGDPDQSIYSWRGADYRNIMEFQKDFPGARVVRLEQNYRSTSPILDAANHLIRHNADRIEKELFTEKNGGGPVAVVRLASDRLEGDWIARAVSSLAAGGRAFGDFAVLYRTNAQSRAVEEALIRAGLGSRYQIVGGLRFYERREVKDLLAHLKLLVNPRDGVSLARVAGCRPTGVGERTLEKVALAAEERGRPVFESLADPDFSKRFGGGAKLAAFAAFCKKLAAVDISRADIAVREVLEASGLVTHWLLQGDKDESGDERVDNLHALVARAGEFVQNRMGAAAASASALSPADRVARIADAASDIAAEPVSDAVSIHGDGSYGDGRSGGGEGDFSYSSPAFDLAAFLEDVALVADVDSWDGRAERISLMSLHSAKGLEFPVVFVTGLETGLLPHRNATTDFQIEEERRLFYVGLTRARELAFATLAATRYINGVGSYCTPSPFLRELPENDIVAFDFGENWNESADWPRAWAHARPDAPVGRIDSADADAGVGGPVPAGSARRSSASGSGPQARAARAAFAASGPPGIDTDGDGIDDYFEFAPDDPFDDDESYDDPPFDVDVDADVDPAPASSRPPPAARASAFGDSAGGGSGASRGRRVPARGGTTAASTPPRRFGLRGVSVKLPTPPVAPPGGVAFVFKPGQAVTHPIFGHGLVTTVTGNKLLVRFVRVGLKTLLADSGQLTPV